MKLTINRYRIGKPEAKPGAGQGTQPSPMAAPAPEQRPLSPLRPVAPVISRAGPTADAPSPTGATVADPSIAGSVNDNDGGMLRVPPTAEAPDPAPLVKMAAMKTAPAEANPDDRADARFDHNADDDPDDDVDGGPSTNHTAQASPLEPLPANMTPPPLRLDPAPQAPVARPASPQAVNPQAAAAQTEAPPSAAPQAPVPPRLSQDEAELAAVRAEGLTGRQLRLARRMAQRHQLVATSDFDAVRKLRKAGIDPFRRANMIDIVAGDDPPAPAPSLSRALTAIPDEGVNLPQRKPIKAAPNERAERDHLVEVQKIQRQIARRRRRRAILLAVRLLFFVVMPTLFCGWYYYQIATPLYATRSEFVIQQAQPSAGGGLGSLFSGTQFATAQDSIAVQGYLQSRDAMLRLDQDLQFKSHFKGEKLDPIQRLPDDASLEAAYKTYARNVKISYDPTEGLIRMEVLATDPETSVAFSRALIGYAEQQVDQLTQRLRSDQMTGARDSFDEAESQMLSAQRRVVELQERFKVLSSEMEVSLVGTQISGLETQLTQERLSLAQMQANESPNEARMEPIIQRIGTLETQIATLRGKLTEEDASGQSLARVQSELLVAQADVQTRQLLLAQSLQQLETARIEANRQSRYLSLSVNPIAPDEAAYPRAFENTMVALLIFAGIYLMISMTTAILREQMTS